MRELKRVSRPLFKRVKEKELRPKVMARLASSVNMSIDFLARVKNLSSEVSVLTEVEITTLESLIQEVQVSRVLLSGSLQTIQLIHIYEMVWSNVIALPLVYLLIIAFYFICFLCHVVSLLERF